MLNIFQRFLYYLLALLPFSLIGFIPYIQQKFTLSDSCMLLLIFITISLDVLSTLYWFYRVKRKYNPNKVPYRNIIALELNNLEYLKATITYLLPLVSIIYDFTKVSQTNYLVLGTLNILILLMILNINLPNPIMSILGYNLYKLTTNEKISGYLVYSKQEIYNLRNIKIIRLFPGIGVLEQ